MRNILKEYKELLEQEKAIAARKAEIKATIEENGGAFQQGNYQGLIVARERECLAGIKECSAVFTREALEKEGLIRVTQFNQLVVTEIAARKEEAA